MIDFFAKYPEFYRSGIARSRNRLKYRYAYCIDVHRKIFKNAKVLDIAAHNGRWTFAAIKNGADYVYAIEPRKRLVRFGTKIFKGYKISDEKYKFIINDIYKIIYKLPPVDVVLCLGFFYHTARHFELIQGIKRLNPKYIVIDTMVAEIRDNLTCYVLYKWEGTGRISSVFSEDQSRELIGVPSRDAVVAMLNNIGYKCDVYHWGSDVEVDDWTDLEHYRRGLRITLLATRSD